MNLAQLLENNIKEFGTYTLLIFEGKEIKNTDILGEANKLGHYLIDRGVKKGHKIIVSLANSPEVFFSYQAIASIGAVFIPYIYRLSEEEILHMARFTEARHALCDDSSYEKMEKVKNEIKDLEIIPIHLEKEIISSHADKSPRVSVSEDDLCAIVFTAGTTGTPKGVMLTHKNLVSNANAIVEFQREYIERDEIALIAVPLSHAFGIIGISTTYLHAKKCILLRSFDIEKVLETIEKYKVTAFRGVPTMYRMLINHPKFKEKVASIKRWGSGSAPLPQDIIDYFKREFSAEIAEGYGLSEACACVSANKEGEPKLGSVGNPLPGIEVKIVDETGKELNPGEVGEIIVKGDNVMAGYYRNPEETQKIIKSGWLYTGDLGYFDRQGYLYISGRKKDLIIRGGFNIIPKDIEDILNSHPGILESAVVGIPDELMGEEIIAYVVKKDKALEENHLRQFLADKISKNKIPKYIRFVDYLPKSATGKILKRILKDS